MCGKTVSHWKSGTYVPVWVAIEVVAREVVAREVVARAVMYTNLARFEWNNCNVGTIEVKETLPQEEKLITVNTTSFFYKKKEEKFLSG